jgi:phosphoribosylformylglycinamidine cyclo-ligase
MFDPAKVRPGDILLGIASNGLHSNGYSLARKACVEGKTRYELRLKRPELGGASLEDALLTPTRIYVKAVRGIIRKRPRAIHALAHITGGGITENLNRVLPDTLDAQLVLGSWPVPPVARFVCDAAHLSEGEALKTFNMGLGMVLVVDPLSIDGVESLLMEADETVFRVGRVVAGGGEVTYVNEGGLYSFGSDDDDVD